MPQYLVAVYEQPETRRRPAAEMAEIVDAVGAVSEQAIDDGIFVFAAGLEDQGRAKTVDARSGQALVTDGPYVETKEYLGGFWVIEVADEDAAITWSQAAALACRQPLEVRALMAEPPAGE